MLIRYDTREVAHFRRQRWPRGSPGEHVTAIPGARLRGAMRQINLYV